MIIYLTLLILYIVAKDSKMQEIGRIMFFCGLLAFLFTGGAVVGVLHR